MFIELNEVEQRLATYVAKLRYLGARENGRPNMKIGGQSNELTDLEGIGAEIAFCKLANVYPDLNVKHLRDEDCYTHNGYAIDVKSTTYENGRLLAVRWKKPDNIDFYALMVGKFPKYRLSGFMRAEDLLKPERLKDFGHGLGYAADQDQLIPPEDLIF